jgi:oligopeptide/dipeptide ABC transporter ATP-binding protein
MCVVDHVEGEVPGFVSVDHDSAGNIYVGYGDSGAFHTYLRVLPRGNVGKCTNPAATTTAAQAAILQGVGTLFGQRIQVDRDAVRTTVFPWLTAEDNVGFGLRIQGMSRARRAPVVERYLRLVGLWEDRRKYPRQLSGGMKQRIQIARALAIDPAILLMDEPFAALDAITRRLMHAELLRIWTATGKSIVFVTHDVSEAVILADRIGVMYAGKLAELGETRQVFENPTHPYTASLLSAFPSIRGERRPLATLPGEPPNLIEPPPGCRFHPRCPYATEICAREEPPMAQHGNHWAACWHPLG